MKPDNVLSMLGLAKKAGNIKSGEFQTRKAISEKEAFLVMVAEDASDNTKKLFTDKCTFYKVPIVIRYDKESLGRAIGNEMRTSVAITNEGFAKAILEKLNK